MSNLYSLKLRQLTTLLPDIKSRDWQVSTQGVGLVAEGLQDIRQCLDICLRTTKGSDPLRPEFGSDIYQYADQPLAIAIPSMVRAIIEAVQIWEKRVLLQKVKYQVPDAAKVDFFITYRLVDDELIDLLKLQLSGGFLVVDTVQIGALTIYALFPPNPSGKRYQISFQTDGADALPAPPPAGFANVQELYTWMAANYSGYGTWQIGADRITGFLKPGILTGSISISLLGTYRYTAPIEMIGVGQKWQVAFTAGMGVPEILSSLFASIEDLIIWLQTNWLQFGNWSIQVNPAAGGDFDIKDFDSFDFDTGSTTAFFLVLESETVNSAALAVNIV